MFFLEKKNQKTFAPLSRHPQREPRQSSQKFFAAFFQKRRSVLLAFLLLAADRPERLLVFGDSLAAGYGLPASDGFQAQLAAALQKDGFSVTILDGGVSGDTSAGGRARIDWALSDNPDAAIVELGGNDGLRGTDPKEMEANLGAILDTLAAHHVRVLLTGMEAPPNLGAAYGAQFRAVFARLGRRPGVMFDRFFLDGVAGDRALNQADEIHPNAAGVARVVARIRGAVERLLK
jgi:acyl-CoA thioesterase-1